MGARGFEPTNLAKVDPLQAPLTVRLKPRGPGQLPAKRTAFGRLLDSMGRPVAGARVFIDTAGPRLGRGYT